KVTVTPAGTFTVVKLKPPESGSVCATVHGVGLHEGLNAPSAPVLPLENPCAEAPAARPRSTAPTMAYTSTSCDRTLFRFSSFITTPPSKEAKSKCPKTVRPEEPPFSWRRLEG